MNAISKLAIAVILVGAIVLAGPTFGFSSIAADRTTVIETASGQSALLGINATNETVTVAGNDDTAQEIGTLTNNLDQIATVSVEVDNISDGNESVLQAGPDGINVDPGASTSATVECAEGTTLGERDVVFSTEAIGSSVHIKEAAFTVTIDIQCGQGGGNVEPTDSGLAGVSAANLTHGEANQEQTIAFDLTDDLQSGENITVTLHDVQHQHKLDYSGADPVTDDPGTVSGSVVNKRYELEFVANEPMKSGDRVTITITGVDATGKDAAKKSPYDVSYLRSDKSDEETTSFDVN